MKSRFVLFKLCKENHRVQSKISDVSFSIEFPFETEIGCFVTRLCTFAHIFSIYNETIFIVERTPHSHSSIWNKHNAHERSPYSFVNITVIPVRFDYFMFCFLSRRRPLSYRNQSTDLYHRQSPLFTISPFA